MLRASLGSPALPDTRLVALRWRRGKLGDFIARVEPVPGPAGNTWVRILAQVPTVFGRLAYLSRLRDDADIYSHPALNQLVSNIVADRTLRNSHHRVFSEWIGFNFAQQKADLEQYLASSAQPVDLAFCRSLVPQAAHEVERLLYITDLETLLEVLRLERGGASANPDT